MKRVYCQVRMAVDNEMRTLLQNLKDMVEAERAARTGKKTKPKKGKKGGKKEKKAKGKKDPTADRTMESLYAELVSNNIIQARSLLFVSYFCFRLGSILCAESLFRIDQQNDKQHEILI